MLTILQTGDPRLKQICAPVDIQKIRTGAYDQIISDMKEVLATAPAVGLAAPQFGLMEQLIVIEDTEDRMSRLTSQVRAERQRDPYPFTVMFNPIVLAKSIDEATFFEGCLSVPGFLGAVRRALRIQVMHLNENGERTSAWFEGWPARIVQHEIDHLNGIEFTDIALPGSIMSAEKYLAQWTEATSDEIESAFGAKQ